MKIVTQLLLSAGLIAGALYIWITQVPTAAAFLERYGVAERLGLTPAAAVEDSSGGRRGGGASTVIAMPVGEGRVDDRLEAIGDGRAVRSVALRAEVSGTVAEIPVSAGSRVEEGAVIVQLDSEAETIALERAQLNLESAREDLERLSQLSNSGAVTDVRLREARLAAQTAELELREAQFALQQRTVRAPFAGWLGVLDLTPGDRIGNQDEIATLTDRSQILIDFRVPERVVAALEPGLPVTVRPLSLQGVELQGRIETLDNVVDRQSRTLRVQALVDNDRDRLRSGMAFAVDLAFEGESLPTVDPLAVQWSDQGSFVWAVREGKATRVSVTIRQRNAGSVAVSADLSPGDMVITEGVQTLRPGADVEVRDSEPTGTEAGDNSRG